mgnify:CR=1 FL=1
MPEGFGFGFFVQAALFAGILVFAALHVVESSRATNRALKYAEHSGKSVSLFRIGYYKYLLLGRSIFDRQNADVYRLAEKYSRRYLLLALLLLTVKIVLANVFDVR